MIKLIMIRYSIDHQSFEYRSKQILEYSVHYHLVSKFNGQVVVLRNILE